MPRESSRFAAGYTLLCLTLAFACNNAHADDTISFEQAGPDATRLWLYRIAGYVEHPSTTDNPSSTPSRLFVPLCEAPCLTSLEPGTYRLGIGVQDDPRILEVDGTLRLRGAETLVGRIESRATLRTTGFALLGVGLASVVAASVIGITSATRTQELRIGAPIDNGPGAGFAILLSGGAAVALVGLLLAVQPDAATLSVQRAAL